MRFHRMAARAFAGAAISILGACGSAPPPPVAVSAAPGAAPVASQESGTSEAQVAAVPAITGARSLIGLTRERIVERFGAAGFVRKDGPAEVWRYRAPECFVELFIYRDADGSQRVAHVDARSFTGRPTPADACVTRLAAERRG
jgi:hypothetical protein